MRDFKVGDIVEFEVGESGYPRWDFNLHNEDLVGVGQAKVCSAEYSSFLVKLETAKGMWKFPQPSNQAYEGMYRDYELYVRLVREAHNSAVCTCDIINLWNLGAAGHASDCPEVNQGDK